MAISVYLSFKGNCREALEFYADVFGAETQKILTYGDFPANPDFPVSEETSKMIMHTFLTIKDTLVMFSDITEEMPYYVGNNISLVIGSKDIEEVKSIFDKLKDGGNIQMELQETSWSKCYGFVTDKFGIGWQVSLEGSY